MHIHLAISDLGMGVASFTHSLVFVLEPGEGLLLITADTNLIHRGNDPGKRLSPTSQKPYFTFKNPS
jgi:hypothetical protein